MKKDLILFEIILKEVDIDEDAKPIIEKDVRINLDVINRGLLNGLSCAQYLTLMLIASHIDKDGKCYPTQARLANQLGMSRESVSQYVHDLKKIVIDGTPLLIVHNTTYNGNKKLIYEVPIAKLGRYVPFNENQQDIEEDTEGIKMFTLDD